MEPALCDAGGAVLFGQTHPAQHDPPPVRVQKALRGIKIAAMVQPLKRAVAIGAVWQVDLSADPAGDIAGGAVALGRALFAKQQHGLPAELEKVGAFAHIAMRACLKDRCHQLPVVQIVRAQQQYSAQERLGLGAQHHPPQAVLTPDLGVAEMRGIAGQGAVDDRAQLLEMHAVARAGKALIGLALTCRIAHIAGIDQHHVAALIRHGRAGIAAMAVERVGGRDRGRQALPMRQIATGDMAPGLVGMGAALRVQLKEHMGAPLPVNQSVRIVHQPAQGRDVEIQAPGIGIGQQRGRAKVGHGIVLFGHAPPAAMGPDADGFRGQVWGGRVPPLMRIRRWRFDRRRRDCAGRQGRRATTPQRPRQRPGSCR